jgi:hypothetical protein
MDMNNHLESIYAELCNGEQCQPKDGAFLVRKDWEPSKNRSPAKKNKIK